MKRYNQPGRYAAVDLGAESGRVILGALDEEGRLTLEVAHRFANTPRREQGGLRWDTDGLFSQAVAGLRRAGDLEGIGVDGWGCDYALLDEQGAPLARPFHHRHARTDGLPERVFHVVSKEELYRRTGTQLLQFNTVFQLLADIDAGLDLARAQRVALIPDLFNYWLTGEIANEATLASTTGLTRVDSRSWDSALVRRLGLPEAPFRFELVEPGEELGEVVPGVQLANAPLVRAVAGHDTASAFAATPFTSPSAGVISCGTWSLVGFEMDRPCVGEDAAAANLGNEWGIDGTTRLLRNVMGLWLLQECRREWEEPAEGRIEYSELQSLAGSVTDDVPLFDPDVDTLLSPGDMSARIAAACKAAGQQPPAGRGEMVLSILLSLSCAFRRAFDDLAEVSGRSVECVHIVGGGALNEVLCRLTADVIGVPVLAGPVEASAIGNLLVQLRAAGALGTRDEMRACVLRSFEPILYEPTGASNAYERFLSVVGDGDREEVSA